jgi:catechol 2,3-dioxygenase-like lactoylglutathione lyase family enzyme
MSDGQDDGQEIVPPLLVGRDQDLALIDALLDRARTDGEALLVFGEPGVGKTALLEAGAAAATVAGTRVLIAQGVEFEAFDYVGLSVAELDAQRRFYANALGLTEDAGHVEIPATQIRTAVLRSQTGLQIELIERGGSVPQTFADAYEGAGVQGYFHWAVTVADLNHTIDNLLAAGATQASAPADELRPGYRYAYVKDPEGNLIELTQPATLRKSA